jgi:hypothetical protein
MKMNKGLMKVMMNKCTGSKGHCYKFDVTADAYCSQLPSDAAFVACGCSHHSTYMVCSSLVHKGLEHIKVFQPRLILQEAQAVGRKHCHPLSAPAIARVKGSGRCVTACCWDSG